MTVTETFFSLEVDDMQRATAFYVDAPGVIVAHATDSEGNTFTLRQA